MTLLPITNIVAGILLSASFLHTIPTMGPYLEKLTKVLGSFQTIIGIVAIVLGVMNFQGLQGIVAIVAGLVLLTGVLPMIPGIGDSLASVAKKVGAFHTAIGIIALILGIVGLL